ncbi:HAD-IA family hydrolase [Pedobacter sp. LMG 31464]|uniref:HAD-IA family hydrolase n=1 Tax=Pedobacter planticolens TaxID=2679964 RepID=A0A923IWD5_9SPHI|nr:HAD-IA family hydrolase [Pedobacter planticolens]MBB2145062.1 HAD-IA family hydrolase [Pedobacter planticolens]
MATIKLLFLDIGGVLLSDGWNHTARMQAVEKFGLEPIQFQKDHAVAFPLFENGKLSLDQYLDSVIFNIDCPFSKEEFKQFMFSKSEQLPHFLPWLIEWKKKNNIKIFSINNEGKEFNDYRIKKFGLHECFDAFISSCEVGFSKPDPSIFKLALGIAQEEPQNCLYFDDRAIHVAIAKQMGFNAHVHKSFEQSKLILESINKS